MARYSSGLFCKIYAAPCHSRRSYADQIEMGVVMEPLSCPMCSRHTLERVLEDVMMSAKLPCGEQKVGGIKAYRCTENGHVFFVRTTDVEAPLLARWSD